MSRPVLLPKRLLDHVADRPDAVAITLEGPGRTQAEAPLTSVTRAELDRRTRAAAAWLAQHTEPGARVLLVYPTSVDFVVAFAACALTGRVAVPATPPDPHKPRRNLGRLRGILADAGASAVLAHHETSDWLARADALSDLPRLSTDPAALRGLPRWEGPLPAPEALLMLQYTSGSTGDPKGVMVTQAAMAANLRALTWSSGPEPIDAVSWLPIFHDMGLIAAVLQALWRGAHARVLDPTTFIRSPVRWLEAISASDRCCSYAPNFGYELCLRKVTDAQIARLDLSRWALAVNAAEPVRHGTMRRFCERFAPCGFDPRAATQNYGLAEATVFVSGALRPHGMRWVDVDRCALELAGEVHPPPPVTTEAPAPDPSHRRLGLAGPTAPDHDFCIADPETNARAAAGVVGEIWFTGPSVAAGYWGRPDATTETFAARLPGDPRRWMRTGDLGLRIDDELVCCGRLKDVVIIRGRNHYPQDIELTAERAAAGLRPGCGAAFPVEVEDEERLVVVQEIDPRRAGTPDETAAAVAHAITAEHEIEPWCVALIAPRAMPKTSSGKVRRREARRRFAAGELSELARWSASTHTPGLAPAPALADDVRRLTPDVAQPMVAAWLAEYVAAHHGGRPWQLMGSSLPALGVDSIRAVELGAEIEAALGVRASVRDLVGARSLLSLAGVLVDRARTASPPGRRCSAAVCPASARAGCGPLEPAAVGSPFILTDGEAALWSLWREQPGSTAYHLCLPLELEAPLTPEPTRAALAACAAAHPGLRTCFPDERGVPRRRVLEAPPLPFAVQELSGPCPTAAIQELTAEPFDLAAAPPWRARWLTRADGPPILVLVLHHILTDLWSLARLLSELGDRLAGAADFPRDPGMIAPDAAAPPDAADWWARQLADPPEPLHIARSGRGRSRRIPLELPAPLCDRVESRARALGLTPAAMLLAAWQLTLRAASGQDEIITGVPCADRLGTRDVFGYRINPLPLRTRFSPSLSARDLLLGVQERLLEGIGHVGLHYSRAARAVRSPYGRGYDNLFVYECAADDLGRIAHPSGGDHLQLGELRARTLPQPVIDAQVPLTLTLAEGERALRGTLIAAEVALSAESAERLARRFTHLLAALVESDRGRIDDLSPLLPDELEALTRGPEIPLEGPGLEAQVRAQAAATPDALALREGDQRWTYARFDADCDALARALVARGVGAEVVVGLCLPRSAALVLAVHAVARAGGAWLPLSPGDPRSTFMARDAGAALVLATTAEGSWPCPAVGLHDLLSHGRGLRTPLPTPAEEDLLYVLYTSGSTGRPKGVMNERGGLANRLAWMQRAYGLGIGDVVLLKTPATFDVSIWELWWPLLSGATLEIAPPRAHLDPTRLARLMRERDVTTVHFVPSMLRAFLENTPPGSLPTLRRVICSGEALGSDLVDAFLSAHPAELHNLYGPTEAAIDVTATRCLPGPPNREIPIGRPIDNTRVHVLDARGRPAPWGAIGELCIGGVQVARGYRDRPQLTRRQFVPGPEGERIYLTGDRARWREDGQLAYHGRIDGQVKLRGIRLEPGEIEAALLAHPAITAAAVGVREPRAGDQRLVAWIVAPGGPPADLRAHLAGRLPAALQPSHVVPLERLPLTSSGKLDRRALPAPRAAPPTRELPRDAREATLLELFREVLGIDHVGVNDDFFELGGHSLLAVQLIVAAEQALSVNLTVDDVRAAGTVQALTARLESRAAPRAPLSAAVTLPDEWSCAASQAETPIADVLLTGGTGYLGAHVLRALLDRSSARIHCLVRAPDAEAGRWRLIDALAHHGISRPTDARRLVAIPGDLSEERWALTPQAFADLARTADRIVHNGAAVAFDRSYARIAPVNVGGTREALRLAFLCGVPLVYVSTISVFPAPDPQSPLHPEDSSRGVDPGRLHSGYCQSKWVAEGLVALAGARGLPVAILRPGTIVGEEGPDWIIRDRSNIFHLLLQSAVQLGALPDLPMRVDLTPVRPVAEATAHLALGRVEGAYTLANPRAVGFGQLQRALVRAGFSIRRLAYDRWLERLEQSVRSGEENALGALLPFFRTSPETFRTGWYTARGGARLLAAAGVRLPPASDAFLSAWVTGLIRSGALPRPPVPYLQPVGSQVNDASAFQS